MTLFTIDPEPRAELRVRVLFSGACLLAAGTLLATWFLIRATSRPCLGPMMFWLLTAVPLLVGGIPAVLLPTMNLRRRRRHKLLTAGFVASSVSIALLVVECVILQFLDCPL